MRRLDHSTRQVLLRFKDPLNRPYPAALLGDLTMSEVIPALGTLQSRGLVTLVEGGFVLTQEGVAERNRLLDADWL